MPEEVVYVIGAPGSNTVKIGRTTNLQKRVAEIQRMSPVPLALLWSHPGGHELETRLHRHFATLRSHGEWFAFRVNAVQLIQWAVEDEPWHRPKVTLKKAVKRTKRVPPPRSPRTRGLDPIVQGCYDDVFNAIKAIPDPVERYKEVERTATILKMEFRMGKARIARQLKDAGRTWDQVGEIFGVTGSRAEQISRGAR